MKKLFRTHFVSEIAPGSNQNVKIPAYGPIEMSKSLLSLLLHSHCCCNCCNKHAGQPKLKTSPVALACSQPHRRLGRAPRAPRDTAASRAFIVAYFASPRRYGRGTEGVRLSGLSIADRAGDGGRKEGLRLRAEEVRQGEEEEGVAAHLSAASV